MNKKYVTVIKGLPFSKQETNLLTGQSYYQTYEYEPKNLDVMNLFEIIQQGGVKDEIDLTRMFYLTDKFHYNEIKRSLPICLFGGEFSGFGNSHLINTSGLICLDFDNIPGTEVQQQKDKFKKDPYTLAVFTSPSGFGLKVIVKLEANTDTISNMEYFLALKEYYNLPWMDDSGKDLTRACFMSHDPDIYVNPESTVWASGIHVNTEWKQQTVALATSTCAVLGNEVEKYIRFLEGNWSKYPMIPGCRNDSCFFRARELAEWGITKEDATIYMRQFLTSDFGEYEMKRQIDRAYAKTIEKGKLGSCYRKL